ncbi:MAG: thioredoxin [Deltaproteobacteria bacterium]|nr:MAG: thioredoxin [Deltaproteobacteria bacterium]
MEIELTEANFDKEVLEATLPVLVDFWAPWCGPCKMVAPIVKELSEEYAGRLKVGKLNTDEHPGLAEKYGIRGIPTLIVFKGGKGVEQLVGALPKSQLQKIIDKHMD